MANYARWTEKTLSVTSLLLDPQNPRIPPSGAPLDQRALIAELVEHDDVLELAKDIAANGYAPIESLVGLVEDDGKTYILEGNRRLAALKLLLSPDSAPEAALKKVRALAKQIDQEAIRKVRVLLAPTRQAAAPLIMQKHTRQQIERWSPLMQARFYRTLAASGETPSDLAKVYGSTPGEIAEFLRTDATYELACRLDLPAAVKAKVHDPRTFPVSTLQRLLDTPKAREVLGIDFNADGAIVGKVHQDEFKRGFTKILSDIVNEKLNTRTINKKEDVEKYLASIKGELPDKKKKGSFTAANFEAKTPAMPCKPTGPAPKKPARKPRQSPSVIPSGVKCLLKSTRITDIFDELRRLRIDGYPNASAVLFRILLELCIGHYLDKTNQTRPLLAKARASGKGNDWYPPLRHLLDTILKDASITIHPLARKKLNKFVSDASSPLSVDGLDSFVHNKFSPPSAKELRSYWETFEELFSVILVEPAPASKRGASPTTK